MFIAASLATQFFFMPETMCLGFRPSVTLLGGARDGKPNGGISEHLEVAERNNPPVLPKTFWQELSFCGQNDKTVSLWQAFARPSFCSRTRLCCGLASCTAWPSAGMSS
jgi:hypothetical protein